MIGAENLVRDEILSKTPTRYRRQSSDCTHPTRKSTPNTLTSSKFKRVEHWLQNQGQSRQHPSRLIPTSTDGEASYEYTDSRESDSEGLADSVATTCLPANGAKSAASTEVIGGSGDLLKDSPESTHSSVVPRIKRRHSERPVSVSCISQLIAPRLAACLSDGTAPNGLANHSISESALNTLNVTQLSMRNAGSKSSLKKRRLRVKRKQRSESGSNASELSGGSNQRGSINSLNPRSEACSTATIIQETHTDDGADRATAANGDDADEAAALPKPKFQLGAYTSVVFKQSALGTLAPLAYYNLNGTGRHNEASFTGTEDTSNLSEQQSWDDYQEKYMSEAYSEGRDSDAARKILEFGDDYRNFIDSQSDCCSSLSAANNLDSMSPPRGRKPFASMPAAHGKPPSKSPSDEDGGVRCRRTLEKEIERRKRSQAENNRKSWNEGEQFGGELGVRRALSTGGTVAKESM